MTTKHYLTGTLLGFGGGLLTAQMRSAESHFTHMIKTAGPGYIGACDLHAGPKEWSPHGLVPKDWQLLFTLDGLWADVLIIYTNIEGREFMTRMNLCGKKYTNLYFVPV